MKSKCLCKAERASLDIISTLPQTIVETILCLLSTKAAARTSILSKEWRYKWTTIPKLFFNLGEVSKRITKEKQEQRKNMDTGCKSAYDLLLKILLLHQGPIHELTLDIDLCNEDNDPFGLEQIILHLSKNHTVKRLVILGWDNWLNLPVSLFSLHHLTDIYLSCVDLDHQPIFSGFGSLRNLCLSGVGISTKTLLHLLSNCPSLKSLSLVISHLNIVTRFRNLSEYSKLLQLIGSSHLGGKDCTILELFKCLPMLEHLTTFSYVFQWLVVDSVPTSLFHLKYFCFEEMCFDDAHGLGFLLVLIRCSPNLEKIKLEIEWEHDNNGEYFVVWEEYSDVWLEHLNEVEIEYFSNSKVEMEFVKFILARSPKLKKVSITCIGNQELEMFKTLLQAPRISPVIITVK